MSGNAWAIIGITLVTALFITMAVIDHEYIIFPLMLIPGFIIGIHGHYEDKKALKESEARWARFQNKKD